MKGWMIYNDAANKLKALDYERARFLETAEKMGIAFEIFSPEDFEIIITRDDKKSILVEGEKRDLPNFVLPRMGAGSTYFTLALIRHFERMGIHCINNSASVEAAKDKLHTQQILAANNLPIPKTMLARFPVNPKIIEKKLGFPLVVKSLSGSQGSGVFLAENRQTFEDLMNMIEAANPQATVILQEFIATSRGRDLRVFVIGGRAVACMLRQSQDDNFKANVSGGALAKAYPLSPEIEWLATQTANTLGLEIAGIDLLFDGEHFVVCEANSAPGFSAIESVCDANIPHEIFQYLQIRLGTFH